MSIKNKKIKKVILEALVDCGMSTYDSSYFLSFQRHIIYNTCTRTERKLAEKWETFPFEVLKWKWTCSGGEGWDEIICWAESLDWVGDGGGGKEDKLADFHEFKEAILQG